MAKSRVATRGLKKRRAYRARVKKSSCRGKRGRTCNKTKGCKYTRGKKRRYCRKSKNRKLSMKGGRRRRTRKRRRRRRQRGGGCPYEKNMGEHFTLRPYNNLSGGDPARNMINSNANNRVPFPYKKSGGGRRKRTRLQKGGSAFQKTGLGDLGQMFYSAGNAITNFGNTWRGDKPVVGGNPVDQPEMLKPSDYRHKIPDVKRHHEGGVNEAAGKGTSA